MLLASSLPASAQTFLGFSTGSTFKDAAINGNVYLGAGIGKLPHIGETSLYGSFTYVKGGDTSYTIGFEQTFAVHHKWSWYATGEVGLARVGNIGRLQTMYGVAQQYNITKDWAIPVTLRVDRIGSGPQMPGFSIAVQKNL